MQSERHKISAVIFDIDGTLIDSYKSPENSPPCDRLTAPVTNGGALMDNVFIERLWWSVKYEEVYLKAYGPIAEARREIGNYFELYNLSASASKP